MTKDEFDRFKRRVPNILAWAENIRQYYIDTMRFEDAAMMRDVIILARRPLKGPRSVKAGVSVSRGTTRSDYRSITDK